MNKKTYIIAGIALIVIVGAYVGLYFLPARRRKEAFGLPSGSKKSSGGSSGSGIVYRDDSFPLSLGSMGKRVAQLQRYLKIDDDGKWGPKTDAAFKASNITKLNGRNELTQDFYYGFQINMQ